MAPLRILTFAAGVFIAVALTAHSEDGPNYTTRVYPGIDGKLVYAPDSLGNTIPDFSNAGYGGGGARLPIVPTREVVWGVEGDATAVIQAAIDRVSALPPDANGFRGAVLIKAGYYDLYSTLTISTGGIVLRGEGQDQLGTILIGRGETKGINTVLLQVSGEPVIPDSTTSRKIRDSYVPVGARTFSVDNAKEYKVGDTILVRRFGNQDWIHELGQDDAAGQYAWTPFDISYDRVITAVAGNTVTVDAPLMCAIEARWGGGDIVRYTAAGRIENVGIENLRAMSDFNQAIRTKGIGNLDRPYVGEEYYSDENHWSSFIGIDNAANCWVRDVTALHFTVSLAIVRGGAKWVTIQDCTNLEPVGMRAGSRRRAFALDGQLTLSQRCRSDRGRHSFVTDNNRSAGPNVFLECIATRSYGSSEPHGHWVTGALYDNVEGPLSARYWKDISIGWSGANVVFWNCVGEFRIQQPPTAQNFTFGHMGVNASPINTIYLDQTKSEGYMESLDRHVTPRSLYLKQLEDRLGPGAVTAIAK